MMISNVLSNTFSSLHSRDFRNFWIGQCISVIGTWIQRTAQTWLAYQMTNSAILVGVLAAFQFLPILFMTLFAGAIIDRYPKRRILMITQSGFLLLGALMTTLVFFGWIRYWQILLIALGYGILQSFDTPTRQSFVFELVGEKDLMNGIALNSSIFNLAKIIGPSIAGILMAQFSIATCFLVDTISYLAVLTGLFFIQNVPPLAPKHEQNVFEDVKTGLHYVVDNPTVRLSAELMMIICTLSFNNNVIIPIYAKTVLHSGAQTFASLMAAVGVGSLIAAFTMGYFSKNGPNRRLYIAVAFGTVVIQIMMWMVHTYWPAMLMMVLIGFCNMIFLNQSNVSFQYSVPNALRGRIMSVYVLLNQGSTPIGSLYVGGMMDLTSGIFGFPACGLLAMALLVPVMLKHRPLIKKWLMID